MFGTIVDLFLIDTLFDETGEEEEDVEAIDLDSDDMDSEIEDDEETANLFILFFLGGSDIDEPYTDLATIITLLQFLEYFEIDIEDEDED